MHSGKIYSAKDFILSGGFYGLYGQYGGMC